MDAYPGTIVIGAIKNEQAADLKGMDAGNTRFVHYPDCQQLIIWLPDPAREYGLLRLIDTANGTIKEESPVTDRLSGSIQIIWDTLPIPPGTYILEIDREKGGRHTIELEKLEEGVIPLAKPPVAVTVKIQTGKEKPPIQYRDGFGKPIINEDLVLREKLIKDLAQKFSRQISYEGNFRSGTIIYSDTENRIEFYHEMGGGDCIFYIDIPTEEQWEIETKTALSLRNEILEFVASTVRAQQAPNCRYEIKPDSIVYYYQ